MQESVFGEDEPSLHDLTPVELRNATNEDAPAPPQQLATSTSRNRVYQELLKTTYCNNGQLSQLDVALPKMIDNAAKDAMRVLVDNVDNICVWVEY